ncbi:kinase-like domain-containing protein [Scenedesmus sp. NREL 46B-D3]|nr:kinase-like domain-containing protein [Scenedesmus sp. NREL 46B-D3]
MSAAGKGLHKNQSPPPYDDEGADDHSDVEDAEDYRKGGYHPVYVGEKFKQGRYVVLKKLGWGHFSTVWLVLDTTSHSFAALKIQKSAQHYTEAARDEITLLSQIRDGDAGNCKHCCRLLDSFETSGPHGLHVCMVFEVLGDNMLALIKAFDYKGVPLPVVRSLTRQMLVALDYLHRELQIIHTDFKPENVMLFDTLSPRHWEMQLNPVSGPPPPAAAAAGRVGNSSGQAPSSSAGLTKNQKKKAKKKAKKAAAANGTAEQQDAQQPQPQQDAGAAGAAGNSSGAVNGTAPAAGDAPAGGSSKLEVLVYESRVLRSVEDLVTAHAVVVDFGNACWTYKHFTDDIQTRQYRSPEVILGAKYGPPADMWSLACVVFELATGDFLFEPKSGSSWDRDEDHVALMIELLGRPPRKVWSSGKYARDFFNRAGELRHIKRLKFWDLEAVLHEKYRLPRAEVGAWHGDFLLPMLHFDPEKRSTAAEALKHPWLQGPPSEEAAAAADADDERRRQRRRSSHKRSGSPSARGGSGEDKRTRSPSPSPAGHGQQQQQQQQQPVGRQQAHEQQDPPQRQLSQQQLGKQHH